jgi:hypothetical protein
MTMGDSPLVQPMTPSASAPSASAPPATIKVVSHSMLFYWWPIWALGFVLGLLTLFDGYRLALVPEGTRVKVVSEGAEGDTFELTSPKHSSSYLRQAAEAPEKDAFPTSVARDKDYGMLFCLVLLVVIVSTSVPLRGLWSALTLLVIVLVAVILSMVGLWGPILEGLGRVHVYISAAGYLFLSSVLFVLWVATVFIFDQRRYMIFTPGQFVVHQEVGDLRKVYDTTNVTVEKRRSDFFRHVLLGFMSGDLLVQTPGAGGQVLVLPNVLFAAARVREIADLMKTRPITQEVIR